MAACSHIMQLCEIGNACLDIKAAISCSRALSQEAASVAFLSW